MHTANMKIVAGKEKTRIDHKALVYYIIHYKCTFLLNDYITVFFLTSYNFCSNSSFTGFYMADTQHNIRLIIKQSNLLYQDR